MTGKMERTRDDRARRLFGHDSRLMKAYQEGFNDMYGIYEQEIDKLNKIIEKAAEYKSMPVDEFKNAYKR